MASLHTISLCALGFAVYPSIFAIREGIQEQGFWTGIKEGIRVYLLSFLFFLIAISLVVKIFTSLIAFVNDIKHKNITLDYIPPMTFDIYIGSSKLMSKLIIYVLIRNIVQLAILFLMIT